MYAKVVQKYKFLEKHGDETEMKQSNMKTRRNTALLEYICPLAQDL